MPDNILPFDGEAVLIDDFRSDMDWPAITQSLLATIPWKTETAKLFGRQFPVPRLTAWFGDRAYSYSGVTHEPTPMPPLLALLRERADVLAKSSFNSVLVNLYRNGDDSVGWHSDGEKSLGESPTIASLSLGAARVFRFRHRTTKKTVSLELRSGQWLIMRGETQRFWLHGIPKTSVEVGPRINLTFRRMEHGA